MGSANDEGTGDGQREKTPSSSVHASRFWVGENESLVIVASEEHGYLAHEVNTSSSIDKGADAPPQDLFLLDAPYANDTLAGDHACGS